MQKISLTTDEKHTIALTGDQTVEIEIDGRRVGCVDFFPLIDGSGPLQIVIDGGPGQEPLAKVLLPADKPPVVVVHKDAGEFSGADYPHAIHHGAIDHIFEGEADD